MWNLNELDFLAPFLENILDVTLVPELIRYGEFTWFLRSY